MYNVLSKVVKKKVVEDLQGLYATRKEFADVVVSDQFPYMERPKKFVYVTFGSASSVHLQAENFMGTVLSYCTLARVKGYPGSSLEWVKEIPEYGLPSETGAYLIEVETDSTFSISPAVDVVETFLCDGVVQDFTLTNLPMLGDYLFVDLNNIPRINTIDFTFNISTNTITFVDPPIDGSTVKVVYRQVLPDRGPFTLDKERINADALPGVVLAFGRSIEVGDRHIVLVEPSRTEAYHVYGGKWNTSISVNVKASDPTFRSELLDFTAIAIQGLLKSKWTLEDFHVVDVDVGADGDVTEVEATGERSFTNNVNVSLLLPWEIHKPIITSALRGFTFAFSPEMEVNVEPPQGYIRLAGYETII